MGQGRDARFEERVAEAPAVEEARAGRVCAREVRRAPVARVRERGLHEVARVDRERPAADHEREIVWHGAVERLAAERAVDLRDHVLRAPHERVALRDVRSARQGAAE